MIFYLDHGLTKMELKGRLMLLKSNLRKRVIQLLKAEKFLPNGKFAVRARKFGSGIEGLSRRDVEIESGAIISSSSKTVDLLDPEFEVVVIMAGIADSPSHPDPFFQKDELIAVSYTHLTLPTKA